MNPLTAIILAFLLLAVVAGIFWPQKGLLALFDRSRVNYRRRLIEDALKYLYDCEYKKLECGLNSIAGSLSISGDLATDIISRLESLGLIKMVDEKLQLTDPGRSYALRVIRVHRVWERYLADETGIRETEWHEAADTQEHLMTIEQANALAHRIGNPVFDPHGDPIPSEAGEIPAHTGTALSKLNEGDIARIIHIEDEPPMIYAQLVASGLYPGMQVRVVDVSEEKIEFIAEGDECVLAPLFASNVTVELLPEKVEVQQDFKTLNTLEIGGQAEVIGISPACRGQQRRRLMDFGVVPGTIVTAEMRSPGGDPTAYRILGATIALRKDHAGFIYIKTPQPNTPPNPLTQ